MDFANKTDEEIVCACLDAQRAAAGASDVEGYAKVLHPEVELIPPDLAPIKGIEAYSAMLKGAFGVVHFSVELEAPAEVEVSGDLAFLRYDAVVLTAPIGERLEGTEPSHRRFLDVYKRAADRPYGWGLFKHTWTLPPAAEKPV